MSSREKLEHHLKQLQERHAELEKKITDGYTHYLDDEHLSKIKHEKLGVKREITKIENNWQNTMKRDYTSGVEESVTFFTGVEIERTPAYGMKTLFVVGVHRAEEIIKLAKEKHCRHIYFGANQSFPIIKPDDARVWKQWEFMIQTCLDADFWCTLDLDVSCAEGLLEAPLVEYRRFIPQLSVKIPYLTQLGYNATIKIDDKDFDATNPGVWCHRLRDLTTTDAFTDWDQYGKDEIVK